MANAINDLINKTKAKAGEASYGGKWKQDDPFAPISAGPNPFVAEKQPDWNMNPLPGSFDISGPGAGEQAWDQSKGMYWNPAMDKSGTWHADQGSGQFGNIQNAANAAMAGGIALGQQPGTMQGAMNAAGQAYANRPGVTNYAEQAFQQYMPGDADFSAYYDNAVQRAGEDIENRFAGLGMAGGGAAMGQTAKAIQDLRAQQAYDSAQYGLSRAGIAGQLGRGADISSAAQSQAEQDWLNTYAGVSGMAADERLGREKLGADLFLGGGQLGLAGTTAEGAFLRGDDLDNLDRLNSFNQGGLGAQGAEEGRIFGGADVLGGFGGQVADEQYQAMKDLMMQDQALMDAIHSADFAKAYEELNSGRYNQQQILAGLAVLNDAAGQGGAFGKGGAFA